MGLSVLIDGVYLRRVGILSSVDVRTNSRDKSTLSDRPLTPAFRPFFTEGLNFCLKIKWKRSNHVRSINDSGTYRYPFKERLH